MSAAEGERKPPALLLAGGRSSRMGHDKAFLSLTGGATLAEIVLERLMQQAGPVAISANEAPERFASFDLPVLADEVKGYCGPLAGIHAGLVWASAVAPEATHLLVVPVDTPFFPDNLSAELHQAVEHREQLAIPRTGEGVHRVCGLFPLALRERLGRDLQAGERRVGGWLARQEVRHVEFAPLQRQGRTLDPFFNINTREDLQTATDWFVH